jgi:CubicO group peptidase (beta-lactamase class C family)
MGCHGGYDSIESFTKYLNLHQQAWPARNDDENNIVVKRSSLREMHQPWRFNSLNPIYKYPDGRTCATSTAYGYGLAILRDCDNKLMVGHSGGLPGFGSNWRILPEYGLGVMLFANVTYAPTAAINMRIIDTILKLTNLTPYTLPPSSILVQRKNALVTMLPNFSNAEKSGIFAENFFPDYPIKDIRQEATAIFNKVGSIISVEEIVPENQLRGRFIIVCEKGKVAISFTLTPENPALIQEYHISVTK